MRSKAKIIFNAKKKAVISGGLIWWLCLVVRLNPVSRARLFISRSWAVNAHHFIPRPPAPSNRHLFRVMGFF